MIDEKKYYEVIVIPSDRYVYVQASKSGRLSMNGYFGGGFRTRDQWDKFEVYPPNWFERLIGVTFEDKIERAKWKVQKWCDGRNWEIREVANLKIPTS